MRQQALGEEERRRYVEAEGLLELLFADRLERHQKGDAGIVDQDIERPVRAGDLIAGLVDAGGRGEIGGDRLDGIGTELLARVIELPRVAAYQADLSALTDKRRGDRRARIPASRR